MAGPERDIAFGRETAARLWRVIRDFATSEVGARAVAMGVALLALLVAINGLNVLNSYVGRDFMTAIERRNAGAFARKAVLYAGVFGLSTVAAVVCRFTEERLGLLWRAWLTRRLVRVYLGGGLYYRLQAGGAISNPDQRIADDVRSFTTGTLSLCLVFLNGAVTIVAFSGVLWSISRVLFGVAVGYALAGSLLAVWFGRSLVRLNYDQSDREASFRADLVRVRENAGSIALLRREPLFADRLGERLDALTANLRRLVAVNRNLSFFTTGYNFMIQLIPALIVAPLFIRGTAEFGQIPQASMAFAHVVGAFSLVVNQFGQLSAYAAVVARLSMLRDAAETAPPLGTPAIGTADGGRRLALERLTLRARRDARVLVRELTLDVGPGACALVTGSSDVTAALERAIAGMWPSGEGRIVRPADLMFLPERSYLPPATLRELLVGTAPGGRAGDDDVWDALGRAGASAAVHRVGGLDVVRRWDGELAPQEQRLLEVARVLIVGPSFVVVRHLEAALGPALAAAVRAALAAGGIGSLALEAEAADGQRFDQVVRIAGDGSWTRTVDTAAGAPDERSRRLGTHRAR